MRATGLTEERVFGAGGHLSKIGAIARRDRRRDGTWRAGLRRGFGFGGGGGRRPARPAPGGPAPQPRGRDGAVRRGNAMVRNAVRARGRERPPQHVHGPRRCPGLPGQSHRHAVRQRVLRRVDRRDRSTFHPRS